MIYSARGTKASFLIKINSEAWLDPASISLSWCHHLHRSRWRICGFETAMTRESEQWRVHAKSIHSFRPDVVGDWCWFDVKKNIVGWMQRTKCMSNFQNETVSKLHLERWDFSATGSVHATLGFLSYWQCARKRRGSASTRHDQN